VCQRFVGKVLCITTRRDQSGVAIPTGVTPSSFSTIPERGMDHPAVLRIVVRVVLNAALHTEILPRAVSLARFSP
jgi:hypothetical protein